MTGGEQRKKLVLELKPLISGRNDGLGGRQVAGMARPPRAWRGPHAGVRGPKDTCPVLLGSVSVEGERSKSAVCTVGQLPSGTSLLSGKA